MIGLAALGAPERVQAQALPAIDICSGVAVNLPVLNQVPSIGAGVIGTLPILGGLGLGLDTNPITGALNTAIGGVNANLTNALSGQPLAVSLLDTNGNLISAPSSGCSVAITSPGGITLGGGRIDGLGGSGAAASTGDPSAIAIGNGSATAAGIVNAVALGTNASATTAGAVAIGSGSVANRLNSANEAFTGSGLRTTLGVASIGAAGDERQLTNVAGGTADTDAVNLRQLRSVGTSFSTALGGGASFNATTGAFTAPSYAVQGTSYNNVGSAIGALDSGLGTTTTNLTNLVTNINNGTIGLVQQNPTTRALTVGAATDGTLLNVAGTAGNRQVRGVAAGTAANDAVNVAQLNGLITTVTPGAFAIASENSGNAAAPTATGLRSVAVGYGSAATVAGTFSVGAAGAERRIVNVAPGTIASGSTDAVTGGQLFGAIAQTGTDIGLVYQRMTASLGGGATYNAGANTFTFPSFTIRGTSYNDVGSAFAAVDLAFGSGGGGGAAAPIRGNSPDGATPPAVPGANSLAGGYQSIANAASSTALGDSSEAWGVSSSSFGAESTAMADGSSAIGTGSTAMAVNTTAIGMNTVADFEGSTAIAAGARALASTSAAIGYQALASGTEAVALGAFAAATGSDSTAVGAYAVASAPNSTALGNEAVASANNTTAVGHSAFATGVDSTAIGHSSSAAGTDSVAIGQDASANQTNTVAIGAGATTTRANQVAIGSGSSTYTLAGLASPASNAAQSGPTRYVTTDAQGNLGTASFGPESISALTDRVGGLTRFAIEARREARSGVASAMAMTSAPMPSTAGKTSWAMNSATFKGEWAGGFAVAHRFDTTIPIAVTAGVSYGAAAGTGVRMGLAGEF